MCKYCSVPTCKCTECPPLKMEKELLKQVEGEKEAKAKHIEGRCPVCGHKYWMMVANF
ncbi:MAG: hypothetical protein ACPLZF_03935 [Nitrososphaeria archaeon]|nr:hypothetical protein [Nitrososphaeria archaeon]